jgi:outer membrane immunogenic protein
MTSFRALLLGVPALLAATPGQASEPTSPPHRWSGCHAALLGSYNDLEASNRYGQRIDNLSGQRASSDLEADGFSIGGGAGCDWQFGRWVVGILGDGSYSDVDDRVVETSFPSFRFEVESDWFATLRGRVGYATDHGLLFNMPTLWYVTAGGAWASLNARNFIPGGVSTADEDTAAGWTVGWGSETAFDGHWTFKTETLYVDFGDNTFFSPNDPVSAGEFVTDTTGWISRIGLTYQFSSW